MVYGRLSGGFVPILHSRFCEWLAAVRAMCRHIDTRWFSSLSRSTVSGKKKLYSFHETESSGLRPFLQLFR
jgi:hypothetical protein